MEQTEKKTSREGNLVKNTFVLSLGTILPKIATFVTLPILTGEYITQGELGIYDIIIVSFLPQHYKYRQPHSVFCATGEKKNLNKRK